MKIQGCGELVEKGEVCEFTNEAVQTLQSANTCDSFTPASINNREGGRLGADICRELVAGPDKQTWSGEAGSGVTLIPTIMTTDRASHKHMVVW